MIEFQEKLDKTDVESTDKVVVDIWLRDQFKWYHANIFKRTNICIYKIRYSENIKKTIDIKWKKILCFIGIKKELRFENIRTIGDI